MEKEKVKITSYWKQLKKGIKLGVLAFVIVVVVAIILWLKLVVFNNQAGKVTTISESSLEKIIEIDELATVDYIYNAVAKVYKDDDEEDVKYYVAYEGLVTAGVNFEEIDIVVNEEEKLVTITVPEVEIQGVNVDPGTLDYIFVKSRYESETVSQEAYTACMKDLEKRAAEEVDIRNIAKENAIMAVKALFEPWIEQVDEEYTVEVY